VRLVLPEGTSILITGASSGIGRALALGLAAKRLRLYLTGRNATSLMEVVLRCREAGASGVSWGVADLATPKGVAQLFEDIQSSGTVISALVNNAGSGRFGNFASLEHEEIARMVHLLVVAPLLLAKKWLPDWQASRAGGVLQVASTGSFQPGPLTAVYYASKAFGLSWALALRHELRGSGVCVTVLCPGATLSQFSSRAGKSELPWARLPEFVARKALKAWFRGDHLVVPGWENRLLVTLSRLLPLSWVALLASAGQKAAKKG